MTDIVRARAEAMWAQDRATNGLGMRLDEVAPGCARISMIVTDTMANGHGICHGGFIFALADSAMAFAANPPSHSMLRSLSSAPLMSAKRWSPTARNACTQAAPACTTCASLAPPASLSLSSAATRAQSAVRRRDR